MSQSTDSPSLSSLFSDSSSPSSNSPPLSSSSAWSMWRYDCRDLPNHAFKGCNPETCPFCLKVDRFRQNPPGGCALAEETRDRWNTYLRLVKNFDSNQQLLKFMISGEELVAKQGISMTELTKSVGFIHKLGTAFFRDGIYPCYNDPKNVNVSIYRIRLFSTTGFCGRPLARRFDKVFLKTLYSVFHLPPFLVQHVNGIFYRCEIDPGARPSFSGGRDYSKLYQNPQNLPCTVKLELWIADSMQKEQIERELICEILELLKSPELGLPVGTYDFKKMKANEELKSGIYQHSFKFMS